VIVPTVSTGQIDFSLAHLSSLSLNLRQFEVRRLVVLRPSRKLLRQRGADAGSTHVKIDCVKSAEFSVTRSQADWQVKSCPEFDTRFSVI